LCVVEIVIGVFTVASEVLGNLHRNRKQHIVFIKKHGALKTTRVGSTCENVGGSVIFVARNGESYVRLFVLIIIIRTAKAEGIDIETVEAVERVVAYEGTVAIVYVYKEVFLGQGVSFCLCFCAANGKITREEKRFIKQLIK
jgi:hypothetical protein